VTVRIALLGSGFVSELYMRGLDEVRGHEVVVNYSHTIERARAFGEKWSIPDHTTDLAKAIQRDDVDLVIIGIPNEAHVEATRLATAAKKHVVCTKPLGRNVGEAREMLAMVEQAGVLHGYAETEVFSPSVMRVRRMIDDGAIGRVFTIRSREAHSGPHAAHFWDAERTGGGALMDMGCHMFEAFRYFLGKEDRPIEVTAWGDRLVHHDKTTAEDNAIAMVRFQSGAIGVAETSWAALGGMDLRNEVYGDRGAAYTDVTRGTPINAFTLGSAGYLMEKASSDQGWVFPVPDEARTYGFHEEMRHFVECVAKGEMPRETYHDGYIINVMMAAAYRSMKSKRWEPIEL